MTYKHRCTYHPRDCKRNPCIQARNIDDCPIVDMPAIKGFEMRNIPPVIMPEGVIHCFCSSVSIACCLFRLLNAIWKNLTFSSALNELSLSVASIKSRSKSFFPLPVCAELLSPLNEMLESPTVKLSTAIESIYTFILSSLYKALLHSRLDKVQHLPHLFRVQRLNDFPELFPLWFRNRGYIYRFAG